MGRQFKKILRKRLRRAIFMAEWNKWYYAEKEAGNMQHYCGLSTDFSQEVFDGQLEKTIYWLKNGNPVQISASRWLDSVAQPLEEGIEEVKKVFVKVDQAFAEHGLLEKIVILKEKKAYYGWSKWLSLKTDKEAINA